MSAAFLALSFLQSSREDGGKKCSSHFDEKSHFDRTLQYIDFLVLLLFQVMKDYQLYLIILVLITIDVIILTTWQIVDPFYRQTKKLEPYVSTVWA